MCLIITSAFKIQKSKLLRQGEFKKEVVGKVYFYKSLNKESGEKITFYKDIHVVNTE